MNFEAALHELETLIEKMESGQLSLEASLQCFEDGVKLTRQCQEALKSAEQKVQVFIEKNGDLSAEPFLINDDV